LTFTTLYPNGAMPRHGVFVENRLRHLLASGAATAQVIAPVPWFPFISPRFGEYAAYAKAPRRELRHNIDVDHPRYPLLPKIGMTLSPLLLALAMRPVIRRLLQRGEQFDVIDAHYFYPDGVAAILLGRWFNKPVVITARGTDLNLIPQYLLPRKLIQWAAARAAGMITVCQALKDVLVELGVPEERVTVLRNGVDLQQFQPPADRAVLRERLKIQGTTLLSVGHLIERKGHDLVIAALEYLPNTRLLIAGDGPEDVSLRALACAHGVAARVTFLGAIKHDQLRDYYGAVDILVLASSREGWANVLLEAMACGTPVVASNVWGTPEVVAVPEAGVLMRERTPTGLADGVRYLLAHAPDRAATRRYAEKFSWEATTLGQLELFARILEPRLVDAESNRS
jgi:glycosyltransferase involved in cell wall biosynthesis